MSSSLPPDGQERDVKTLGSASLDGAPLAYIVVLAAVVTALAFIPFSIILGSGGGMPLSQSVFPLIGWILGPIGGAIASGIGTLVGVLLAPYTAGVPFVSVLSAALASFAAGTMVLTSRRQYWWIVLTIILTIELLLYLSHAIAQNGVAISTAIAGSFVDWSALLLFALPTRTLFARWINSANIALLVAGLFLGSWMISGLAHINSAMITYYLFNWPEEIWISLIPIIPFENLIRSLAGAVIGAGVISGLRVIGLVKPKEAIY
ncbi:MAG: hypothetical protein VKJ02_17720 [Snowella sp.]|nr:hypothetical protein [Snowella sp.]